MIPIAPGITLDESELTETFIRASGPGGQNVNKVSTAVQLRLDVAESPSLPAWIKDRLRALAGRRLSKEGVLIITAQKFRTQEMNRADARDRLADLLHTAAARPLKRRPTKPTHASHIRRRQEKKSRSAVKQSRRAPIETD